MVKSGCLDLQLKWIYVPGLAVCYKGRMCIKVHGWAVGSNKIRYIIYSDIFHYFIELGTVCSLYGEGKIKP